MSSIGSPTVNKIILGDNLEILRGMPDESVDLIYLDPPFFSNRDYEVIWGDEGEIRSFKDRWAGGSQGVQVYIDWLKERIQEMYRVLKKTGSFYLHCDWHADADIRVDILNPIFNRRNFRNEITWKRQTAKKGSQFARKNYGFYTDKIFFYTKSARYTFQLEKIRSPEEENKTAKRYNKIDSDGKRFRVDHIELIEAMSRENLIYEYKGYTPSFGWMMVREKLEQFDKENRLYWSETGKPYRKYFLDEYEGKELTNLWDDITIAQGEERIGYPTQKPEALLERIIKASSNPGDVVLDPFVGGGTTIAVADKLGRQWIGIDQSVAAVKVSELRLNKQQDLLSVPFSVHLHKYDYDTLRKKESFEFEKWIVQQYGGIPNDKQRGDGGLDGRMQDGTFLQVKRQDSIGRNYIDNFKSAMERADKKNLKSRIAEKKTAGIFIAFSFGKGAVEEVARLKMKEGIIIKLLTVEDIVPIAKKPKIKVAERYLSTNVFGQKEIEFIAKGESDAGIEFYSWDFAYDEKEGFKPVVIRDTDGLQKYNFNVGVHHIAVKVVDNEGLESIETLELHVNGGVKRKKKSFN